MNTLTINQNDNNKSFSASVADLILITLKENPTTGYRWKLLEFDKKIMKEKDSQFVIQNETEIGAGGNRIFSFNANSKGKTKIEMILKREWEKNEIERFVILIEIL